MLRSLINYLQPAGFGRLIQFYTQNLVIASIQRICYNAMIMGYSDLLEGKRTDDDRNH